MTNDKQNREKRFVLVTDITGNIDQQTEIKKIIDVTSIREIRECDEYFGFTTTEIIFDNGLDSVHVKMSIDDTFEKLKKAEKI